MTTPTPTETTLNSLYSRCGLNADWSVQAWCLSGTPNSGPGTYITDNEDGTFSLVHRVFTGGDDEITILATWNAETL